MPPSQSGGHERAVGEATRLRRAAPPGRPQLQAVALGPLLHGPRSPNCHDAGLNHFLDANLPMFLFLFFAFPFYDLPKSLLTASPEVQLIIAKRSVHCSLIIKPIYLP